MDPKNAKKKKMKRKKPIKSSIEKSPPEWERHKLLPTGIVGLASAK